MIDKDKILKTFGEYYGSISASLYASVITSLMLTTGDEGNNKKYGGMVVLLIVATLIGYLGINYKNNGEAFNEKINKNAPKIILWGIFFVILLFMLGMIFLEPKYPKSTF